MRTMSTSVMGPILLMRMSVFTIVGAPGKGKICAAQNKVLTSHCVNALTLLANFARAGGASRLVVFANKNY